mgnify:FL=1
MYTYQPSNPHEKFSLPPSGIALVLVSASADKIFANRFISLVSELAQVSPLEHSKEPSSYKEGGICPFCGDEMKAGYMISGCELA